MHIDLQRIVEDQEIKMNIPIHYVGEDVAPGVKAGGSVSHLITDVEVQCLPRYLPEYFEVDISKLGLDEMLHLSDLEVPEGVEIPELAQGPEHDQAIVSIQVIKVVEIEEDVEDEAAEGEAAEGEEAAEGDDAAESGDDEKSGD
jgi:large subunit ribosomal protein L25